jgi:hypothetical protein
METTNKNIIMPLKKNNCPFCGAEEPPYRIPVPKGIFNFDLPLGI